MAVAIGGALGAVCRFWLSTAVYLWFGRDFPYGTLAVNVFGSFLIGILSFLMVTRFQVDDVWR
ncbi:MAG: CrcB family protein, partial [Pseudomonadota bacterium]